MKTMIIYGSKTGNTKKIADAIQEKLHADHICSVEEWGGQSLDMYDLLVIGGWIDKGDINESIRQLMESIHHKKVAFFFTLGAYPTSMHAYDCLETIKANLLKNDNQVIAHFHCQGAVDEKLIEWMKALPEGHGHSADEVRVHRWEDARKHPNQEDIHSVHSFVANLKRKLVQNV